MTSSNDKTLTLQAVSRERWLAGVLAAVNHPPDSPWWYGVDLMPYAEFHLPQPNGLKDHSHYICGLTHDFTFTEVAIHAASMRGLNDCVAVVFKVIPGSFEPPLRFAYWVKVQDGKYTATRQELRQLND